MFNVKKFTTHQGILLVCKISGDFNKITCAKMQETLNRLKMKT